MTTGRWWALPLKPVTIFPKTAQQMSPFLHKRHLRLMWGWLLFSVTSKKLILKTLTVLLIWSLWKFVWISVPVGYICPDYLYLSVSLYPSPRAWPRYSSLSPGLTWTTGECDTRLTLRLRSVSHICSESDGWRSGEHRMPPSLLST